MLCRLDVVYILSGIPLSKSDSNSDSDSGSVSDSGSASVFGFVLYPFLDSKLFLESGMCSLDVACILFGIQLSKMYLESGMCIMQYV